jgi:hypothetical protein
MKYLTNYSVAAHWLNGSLIMCNDIANVDPSIFENARFETYDDETEEYTEIYQYFLTNYDACEVEFLEKHFNLLFTYSDALDLFVLCVDHYGTAWDYVTVETDLEAAARELGETK